MNFLNRMKDLPPKTPLIFGAMFFSIFVVRLINFISLQKFERTIQVYIGNWHIHHIVWGAVLMLASAAMLKYRNPKSWTLSFFILGTGLGFVVDEVGILIYDTDDYWSMQSLVSILAIMFLSLVIIWYSGIRPGPSFFVPIFILCALIFFYLFRSADALSVFSQYGEAGLVKPVIINYSDVSRHFRFFKHHVR